MHSFSRVLLVLSIAIAVPAWPQALVEHAAAASGASIGAAGGKVVSNGITAIFGKVDETTTHAAGKEPEKPKAEKPGALGSVPSPAVIAGPAGSYESTPAGRQRRSSTSRRTRTGPAASAPTQEPVTYARIVQPPVKEPAVQDLLGVPIGSKEQDCIASLGRPSSRITIPEEGHLMEVLRYSARGQLLGIVRLDNGQVVNVQAVNIPR